MNYRLTALILLAACRSQPALAAEAAPPERPNVLFIMSDDHCAQAVSAYGGSLAQIAPTPNLDRLAEEGMLFRN